MESFSMLLQGGLPFDQSLLLAFKNSPAIEKLLQNGVPFSKIVQSSSTRSLKALGMLMEMLSLTKALAFFKQMNQTRKILQETILKPCIYPLFLMTFVSALSWFFSVSIVPAMSEWSGGSSMILLDLIRCGVLVFWTAAGSVVFFYLMIRFGHQDQLLRFAAQHIKPVRKAASCQCALFFECAQENGMNTSDLLKLMESSPSFIFAGACARQWKKQMKKGRSLAESIELDNALDAAFKKCYALGTASLNLALLMKSAQKSMEKQLQTSMKKISGWILYTSYAFAGVLAASVYQIMLEPLSMLESF